MTLLSGSDGDATLGVVMGGKGKLVFRLLLKCSYGQSWRRMKSNSTWIRDSNRLFFFVSWKT